MKLTKPELKQLMKEALLELVKEGVFSKALVEAASVDNIKQQLRDNVNKEVSVVPDVSVNNMAASLGKGDPKKTELFKSILADTAKTTAVQTMLYETQGYTPEQVTKDQQELKRLGDASKWAHLAFSTKKTNNTSQ